MRSVNKIALDPAAKKKVTFDWSAWLTGESTSVASYTLTPSTGITVHSDSETGGKVTALISASKSGRVTCHIVCADTQEDERTMYVRAVDQ